MSDFTTRPDVLGTFGVAASTHWLASQSAMRMLEIGGNAFDAAVAGAFVLQVAEPHLNGPLGDVPIIIHDVRVGREQVICGQGPAPAAASIEAFAERGITDVIPGDGLLPAVVPGAFDAWMHLLEEHGTVDLETALSPAIGYARHGVPVIHKLSTAIDVNAENFRRNWPTSAAVWLPDDRVPEPGSLLENGRLADMWERLLREAKSAAGREGQIRRARQVWSEGFIAETVDAWCREARVTDQTGRVNDALLRGDDMAGWSASVEEPIGFDFAGVRILKCGPWTQGPVLLQTLAILDGMGLADVDPDGPEFVHSVAEAMKLSYADRDTFYGDPDVVETPLDVLLSSSYSDLRRGLIGADASMEFRPGSVDGFGWSLDYTAAVSRQKVGKKLAAAGRGEPTTAPLPETSQGPKSGDTCYICVIDRDGNMVSATPSGGWLTSSPVIPDLGVPLGTRLQMTWLDASAPAALRPGVRPRITLTPSMVLRDDGKPQMCLGTPGGDGQDQWQVIFLLRHLLHGQSLQTAIDAPSFHSEHWPNSFSPRHAVPGRLVVEGRFADRTIAELRSRGHDVDVGPDWSEGRLCAASRSPDGILAAGANPRGMQNYAVGR